TEDFDRVEKSAGGDTVVGVHAVAKAGNRTAYVRAVAALVDRILVGKRNVFFKIRSTGVVFLDYEVDTADDFRRGERTVFHDRRIVAGEGIRGAEATDHGVRVVDAVIDDTDGHALAVC